MSKKRHPPPRIKFVRRVTRQHGKDFADYWGSGIVTDGGAMDALDEAGIMEWPDPDLWESPAQDRANDLVDEILELTFEIAHDAIAAAFTTAAGEVTKRERLRQKRARRKRS